MLERLAFQIMNVDQLQYESKKKTLLRLQWVCVICLIHQRTNYVKIREKNMNIKQKIGAGANFQILK